METRVKSVAISAYSWKGHMVIPGDRIPMEMGRTIGHEGGHCVSFDKKFDRLKILKPSDIEVADLGLSEARKRWLQELLASSETVNTSWQPELLEVIWQFVSIITRNKFRPNGTNVTILPTSEDLKKQASTQKFADITFKDDETIANLTNEGYRLEVPAYYMQRGVTELINRAITPYKAPKLHPILPSHKMAYDAVEKWFNQDQFPTPKIIKQHWANR